MNDRAAIGRANRRAGADNERKVLAKIREYFPGAARTRAGESGADMANFTVAGWSIEITRVAWTEISRKLIQSSNDAAAAGTRDYCVFKGTPGKPSTLGEGPVPMKIYCVMDADVALATMVELEGYRAAAPTFAAALQEGYSAGYEDGRARRPRREFGRG
jgi:hypothetical protein